MEVSGSTLVLSTKVVPRLWLSAQVLSEILEGVDFGPQRKNSRGDLGGRGPFGGRSQKKLASWVFVALYRKCDNCGGSSQNSVSLQRSPSFVTFVDRGASCFGCEKKNKRPSSWVQARQHWVLHRCRRRVETGSVSFSLCSCEVSGVTFLRCPEPPPPPCLDHTPGFSLTRRPERRRFVSCDGRCARCGGAYVSVLSVCLAHLTRKT